MDTHVVSLRINVEQEAAIRELFQQKGWLYEPQPHTSSGTAE